MAHMTIGTVRLAATAACSTISPPITNNNSTFDRTRSAVSAKLVGYPGRIAQRSHRIVKRVPHIRSGPSSQRALQAATQPQRCRARILRGRGDSRLRGGRHHRHATKAYDLELQGKGRFGKQDFVYTAADDVYICPARERLTYRATTNDAGKMIRRYWTSACRACALKLKCTPEATRRVSRWEHEAVLETVQARLDHHPEKMTIRRQTAEHPFGTIKCWMGATHFLTKRLPKVATEMALNVLAYNIKRVMALIGVAGLLEALAT